MVDRLPLVTGILGAMLLPALGFGANAGLAAFSGLLAGACVGSLLLAAMRATLCLWQRTLSLFQLMLGDVAAAAGLYCGFWFMGTLSGGIPNQFFQPTNAAWVREWYGLPLLPPLIVFMDALVAAATSKGGIFNWASDDFSYLEKEAGFTYAFCVTLFAFVVSMCVFIVGAPFLLAYSTWGAAEVYTLFSPFERAVSLMDCYLFWLNETLKGAFTDITKVFHLNIRGIPEIDTQKNWVFGWILVFWRWIVSLLFLSSALFVGRRLVRMAWRRRNDFLKAQ